MDHNRRTFLSSTGQVLGAGWLTLNWPAIAAAAVHAQAAAGTQTLTNLTAEQALDLEAVSAQIIPTDETPGAREAGVIYFIDKALGGFFAAHRAGFLADYAEFGAEVAKQAPDRRFATLPGDRQVRLLQAAEGTRFFGTARFLTVVGFLASPQDGGNRNGVGWQVVGFSDEHVFHPPFGYYDRDYAGFVPYDLKGKA